MTELEDKLVECFDEMAVFKDLFLGLKASLLFTRLGIKEVRRF